MDDQNPQHDPQHDPHTAPHQEDTHPVFGSRVPPWEEQQGPEEPQRATYADQPEPTRTLPPFVPAGAATAAPPAPRKRAGGLTAGVLVGALVLGGAAGVGGAAAYDSIKGDDTSSSGTSTTSPAKFEATKTGVLANGSVEKVAGLVLPSVVKVNVSGSQESGSGSGFVLSKDGLIVTNNHVASVAGDNGSISVSFNDGTTKKATIVGTDPLTDIAVIKAEGVSDLKPAALGKSSALRVGQTVVAIGSPFGLNSTVTSGIVSALNRPVSVSTEQQQQQDPFGQGQQQGQSLSTTYPAIQTDAAINPGNSGGPLVDTSGRVVGINSSIRTSSSSLSGDSGGSIGLGFAIPIDEILPIVNQLVDNQKPTHARLAVTVSDVENSVDNGGDVLQQGAVLQSVEQGGAGDKAGLKKGDRITKVDDQVIDGSESLVATIRGHRPDEQVTLTYVRDGQTRTVTATLGSDEDTQNS